MWTAFKGATGYEAQLWRVAMHLPYWRFLRCGALPRLYIDRS